MDTIFMNSKNSKTSKLYVLILQLIDKLDLRRVEKSIALSNVSIYYTWKNMKNSSNNKIQLQHGIINLNNRLPDGSNSTSNIQDYFNYILKKHNENIDNPVMRIYVNKSQNRVTFTIKTGYYLELLTPGTMKLLGTTENKITKDKNGENVPHLLSQQCQQ